MMNTEPIKLSEPNDVNFIDNSIIKSNRKNVVYKWKNDGINEFKRKVIELKEIDDSYLKE